MAGKNSSMIESKTSVSVVVPTYQRNQILVETIEHLLALEPAADEVLIVDQTPAHLPEVVRRLASLEKAGKIQWLRLDEASIPHAMNVGLLSARSQLVLFVDDDVVPVRSLVLEHRRAHSSDDAQLVVGRVQQPWGAADIERTWRSTATNAAGYRYVEDFMGGNFSVRRTAAIELGGFDENFVGAAFRFEAEFASRLWATGGSILFAPRAEIQHLQTPRGGTRAHGHHLQTLRPHHSVGEYYFLLRGAAVKRRWRRLLLRPLRSVRTRFHLRHPWWIPLSLLAEARGLVWALRLFFRGPRHIQNVGVPK